MYSKQESWLQIRVFPFSLTYLIMYGETNKYYKVRVKLIQFSILFVCTLTVLVLGKITNAVTFLDGS